MYHMILNVSRVLSSVPAPRNAGAAGGGSDGDQGLGWRGGSQRRPRTATGCPQQHGHQPAPSAWSKGRSRENTSALSRGRLPAPGRGPLRGPSAPNRERDRDDGVGQGDRVMTGSAGLDQPRRRATAPPHGSSAWARCPTRSVAGPTLSVLLAGPDEAGPRPTSTTEEGGGRPIPVAAARGQNRSFRIVAAIEVARRSLCSCGRSHTSRSGCQGRLRRRGPGDAPPNSRETGSVCSAFCHDRIPSWCIRICRPLGGRSGLVLHRRRPSCPPAHEPSWTLQQGVRAHNNDQ